ncbi:hypothetical protein [Gordonia sp. KTR9]|uniref:hypothetical protein n=1 Tax=Gordonia sp. KTR9 TaxID=337191 RepID=UPI00027DDF50|nr:hypothetical protein [Gordonia sp. KTR9]AFR49496.1 hypothetical protein KTR9_2859 [Gordonia sp. KTR9]
MSDLDDRLALLRSTIGVPVPVEGWNRQVTAESVRHFAAGIGDDNPLWETGGRVPPTYLYSCSSVGRPADAVPPAPSSYLPGFAALWKGDRWTFHSDVELDRCVRTTVELAGVEVRTSRSRGRVVELEERYCYHVDDTLLAECHKRTMRFARADKALPRAADAPAPPSYTLTELDDLMRESLRESHSDSRPVFGTDVRVGDRLGTLVKGPLTVTSIIAWLLGWGSPLVLTDRPAHRMWSEDPASRLFGENGYPDTAEAGHWDTDIARQNGLARGYDFGAQRISWLAQLVTDWCGDVATIVDLDAKLLAPNLIGDLTRISGEVVTVGDDGRVECTVRSRNQRDEITAAATIAVLPRWAS